MNEMKRLTYRHNRIRPWGHRTQKRHRFALCELVYKCGCYGLTRRTVACCCLQACAFCDPSRPSDSCCFFQLTVHLDTPRWKISQIVHNVLITFLHIANFLVYRTPENVGAWVRRTTNFGTLDGEHRMAEILLVVRLWFCGMKSNISRCKHRQRRRMQPKAVV